MRRLCVVVLAAALAGCAPMTTNKVDIGDKTVGERLVLKPESAWNELPGDRPAHVWTMEGVPIDRLLIYSGIKDGDAIDPPAGNANAKRFRFRSTMQADEIVAMFEGMLTRDQSSFELVKLEPATFGGSKGVRFEYKLLRKADNVPLSGVGFGTVDNGQLFAILYNAPRLAFFPRHRAEVEHLAQSARLLPTSPAAVAAAPATPVAATASRPRTCFNPGDCQGRGGTP